MYGKCGETSLAGTYNPLASCVPPPELNYNIAVDAAKKQEDIRTIMSEVHDLVVDVRGMLFTINTELQGYENTEKQPDVCVNNMLDLVKKVRMDASSVRAEAAKLAKVLGV